MIITMIIMIIIAIIIIIIIITVDRLICACSKIAQTDCRERHNNLASMLHRNLCKKYNIPAADKWRENKVAKAVQKIGVKILLGFNI